MLLTSLFLDVKVPITIRFKIYHKIRKNKKNDFRSISIFMNCRVSNVNIKTIEKHKRKNIFHANIKEFGPYIQIEFI